MELVTIQPYRVYKDLISSGRYACDAAKCDSIKNSSQFTEAYSWLSEEMTKRIGQPPNGVKYPVWAWYRCDNYKDWPPYGKTLAKITLDIDPARVLLSDFEDWHCVLNRSPLLTDEEAESDFEANWNRYYSAGLDAIKTTWQRVFHSESQYVQATFWQLLLTDIVDVEIFVSKDPDKPD